jgi:hypothetical protein
MDAGNGAGVAVTVRAAIRQQDLQRIIRAAKKEGMAVTVKVGSVEITIGQSGEAPAPVDEIKEIVL